MTLSSGEIPISFILDNNVKRFCIYRYMYILSQQE